MPTLLMPIGSSPRLTMPTVRSNVRGGGSSAEPSAASGVCGVTAKVPSASGGTHGSASFATSTWSVGIAATRWSERDASLAAAACCPSDSAAASAAAGFGAATSAPRRRVAAGRAALAAALALAGRLAARFAPPPPPRRVRPSPRRCLRGRARHIRRRRRRPRARGVDVVGVGGGDELESAGRAEPVHGDLLEERQVGADEHPVAYRLRRARAELDRAELGRAVRRQHDGGARLGREREDVGVGRDLRLAQRLEVAVGHRRVHRARAGELVDVLGGVLGRGAVGGDDFHARRLE